MEDNALGGRLAYVTTPAFMASLKTTEKLEHGPVHPRLGESHGGGYPVVSSNQVTASHLIFETLKMWCLPLRCSGRCERSFQLALTGMIGVHIGRYVDVGIRHGRASAKLHNLVLHN